MAAITNSNPNSIAAADHSPRHTIAAADHSPGHTIAADNISSSSNQVSSPQSRRASGKQLSPPWARIVRGAESEFSSTASTGAEQADAVLVAEEESVDSENNVSKRPVWNKPLTVSNGPVEIGNVMGADSWPALSESAARASSSTKSSSDSLKGLLSDGSSPSISVSQGIGTASSSSQKQVANSANANSTPNLIVPVHQRSMKRNGANTTSNVGAPQSPGSQGVAGEGNLNNSSSGDHGQRNSHSRSFNDHPQQQRNSFRNRNVGPHSRGDGSHHHSYGGRRNDQDRSNQDWNAHRNFNRDGSHVQPSQGVSPRLMRHQPPPPAATTFVAPPPVRPFGPMGFPDMRSPLYYVAPHPDSMRGVPIIATPIPPHAVFFPSEPQLHNKILHQIDYYFSNENLVKDTYLRKNMDDHGWVPIKLIASFNKVSLLTDNIQLILDAVRNSSVIELQGEKVRKRNDWMRWIMTTPIQSPNVSSPQSGEKSGHDMLAANVQGISLEEMTAGHSNVRSQADVRTEAFLGGSLSGDFNSQSQLCSSKGIDENRFYGDFDLPTSSTKSSK
uniref:HTH La-type RNA-binding domain-containing protein n=1 Tax=Salix viminalis TaxID=40686 RepID=A0A6N2N4B5_SALVM